MMLARGLRRVQRFLGATFQGNNDKLTVFFLKKAAAKGDGWSQNNLANYYLLGTGVDQSVSTAMDLYLRAAGNSVMSAYLNLGQIYYEGKYVERNDQESAIWFLAAANTGDPTGEYRLGLMYYDGIGIEKDHDKALFYLKSAKNKGIVVNEDILDKLGI